MSKNRHWQYVEEVVAILEKTLTPAAKVEHNVRLPVVGRPEREPRQCDVVITYGEQPRQTIAIVEVQDRSQKPSITTFHGWIRKMQEVGAQHLICVSRQGYPKSIINEVMNQYGPTVKLMTLDEILDQKIGQFAFVKPYLYKMTAHCSIEATDRCELFQTEYVGSISNGDKTVVDPYNRIFSLGEEDRLFSLINLVDGTWNQYISSLSDSSGFSLPPIPPLDLVLDSSRKDLWITIDENKYRVQRLPLRLTGEWRIETIPLTLHTYHQEDIDGDLVWVASAYGIVDGEEESFQILFRPDDEGLLHLHSVAMKGANNLTLIVSSDKGAIEQATGPYEESLGRCRKDSGVDISGHDQ